MWHADSNSQTIYALRPSDGAIMLSYPSPGTNPTGLGFHRGQLWGDDTGCSVNLCTPDSLNVGTLLGSPLASFPTPGGFPTGAASDGRNLWLSDNETDLIYRVDPLTLTILSSFPAPETFPNDLAWDGHYLWVVDNETNRLYQYDVH